MTLCLHELDPGRRAPVALDSVISARREWSRQHRRPAALTAREALVALQFEASVVWTVGANLRNGCELTEDDWERMTLALRRIDLIVEEAAS